MKTVSRYKMFIKDRRNVRLTDKQATKLFLYIACLLKNEPLPPESKNHSLQGEWSAARELLR
jgi:mRNA interferase YafQ